MHAPSFVAAVIAAAGLSACASIQPAAMELPPSLAATAPQTWPSLGAARDGALDVMGHSGRFERRADRLELFGAAAAFDRAGVSYTLRTPEGGEVTASCRGRRISSTLGIIATTPRALEVQCQYSGAFSGTLLITERSAAAGTRTERSGRLTAGATQLDVASVHRVQGSPLPLAAPIGYTFTSDGRTVGAVEVNGTRPRLWAADASPALQRAMLHAALALALLWDPQQTSG